MRKTCKIPGQMEAIWARAMSRGMGCVYDHSNPPDCPLHEARQLPLNKMAEWLESLSDDELIGLDRYCHTCLHLKDAAGSNHGSVS